MTDADVLSIFEQSVTVALDREFDPSKTAQWRAALPAAWSMTVLLQHLDSTREVERVLRESGGGHTLAVLMGATRSLATAPNIACTTLTDCSVLPITTILVAIGAPRARSRTMRTAARIAARTGAALFGVHCVQDTTAARSKGAVLGANARVVAQGDARVAFESVRVEPTTNAVAAVEAVAREVRADLVVVGKRSARSKLASALSRSLAFSTLAVS